MYGVPYLLMGRLLPQIVNVCVRFVTFYSDIFEQQVKHKQSFPVNSASLIGLELNI